MLLLGHTGLPASPRGLAWAGYKPNALSPVKGCPTLSVEPLTEGICPSLWRLAAVVGLRDGSLCWWNQL